MKKKIALFASGSGTNAENMIRYFDRRTDVVFPVIVTNKASAYVHERAKQLGVPSYTFDKEEFENGTVLELLQRESIDFIILAGFLLKIPENLLQVYPNRIINIHPALLPKFGGKGMYGMRVHEAVVEAGEKESGITIHYVNENYDEGKIIFQATCTVLSSDSAKEVAEKVHELEYDFFPKVVEKIIMNDDCH